MSHIELTTPAGHHSWLYEAHNFSPTLGSWVRALAIAYPDPTQQLTVLLDFLRHPTHCLSLRFESPNGLIKLKSVQPLAIALQSEGSRSPHLVYSDAMPPISSTIQPPLIAPPSAPSFWFALLLLNPLTNELFWAFPSTARFSLSSDLKDDDSPYTPPQLPSILLHDINVGTFTVALLLVNNKTLLRADITPVMVPSEALQTFLEAANLSHLNIPDHTFLTVRPSYSLSDLPGAPSYYTLQFEISIHEPFHTSDPFFLSFTFQTHATLKAVDTLFHESLILSLLAYHQLLFLRTAYQPLSVFNTRSVSASMDNPTWLLGNTDREGTLSWNHGATSPEGRTRLHLKLILPSHPEPLRQFVNTTNADSNPHPLQLTPEILQQISAHTNQLQLQQLSC